MTAKRTLATLISAAMLVTAGCASNQDAEVARLSGQIEGLNDRLASAEAATPTQQVTPQPAASPADPAANADCPALQQLGYTRAAMLDYWQANDRPARLDGDGDGIPCDITFPEQAAPPVAAVAPSPQRAPQGVVELADWENDIEYSDACAKVRTVITNRSDTAVKTVWLRFHNDLDDGTRLDLGEHERAAGIPPFDVRVFNWRICDERMRGQQYGPAAVPDRFRWEWFKS
jgi:outer membrane murein-binding lipoprotein Lpp